MPQQRIDGDDAFVEYAPRSFSSDNVQAELHSWLAANPDATIEDGRIPSHRSRAEHQLARGHLFQGGRVKLEDLLGKHVRYKGEEGHIVEGHSAEQAWRTVIEYTPALNENSPMHSRLPRPHPFLRWPR